MMEVNQNYLSKCMTKPNFFANVFKNWPETTYRANLGEWCIRQCGKSNFTLFLTCNLMIASLVSVFITLISFFWTPVWYSLIEFFPISIFLPNLLNSPNSTKDKIELFCKTEIMIEDFSYQWIRWKIQIWKTQMVCSPTQWKPVLYCNSQEINRCPRQ